MRTRQTRRACHARLDALRERGLAIPRPFDAEELSRRIGGCLGRPIRLLAMSMPSGVPYGLTLVTDDCYAIAYEERTSRVHQDLIIAHELGHILFGHRAMALDDEESSVLLMPALRPSLVRHVMGRRTGVYTEAEEHEAEMMGTVLVEVSNRAETDTDLALGPEQAELYERLRRSLEHPGR
jgi:hypothetical protein